MKLNHLIAVAAASALMGGAAYAQVAATPDASVTTTTSTPAGPVTTTDSTTTSAGATTATSATTYASGASVTTSMVTNGPVPDTAENRAKYGQPMSHAGKRSKPKGN